MTLSEALRRLYEQERIRAPWLPGMAATDGDRWLICDHERALRTGPWWRVDVEPDLSDPATTGCLLALLREAVAPWVEEHQTGAWTARALPQWLAWVRTGPHACEPFKGDTEGEAIKAALIALAGGS